MLCGKKKEENLHSEELHDFYSSRDIIHVKKPRRIRWADHFACRVARKS
jgi:hypothetical protein